MSISAISYTRFSSDKQDNNSIEMQTQAISDFAAKNNYEVVRLFADEATSGREDNREQFLEMYTAAMNGSLGVDTIVIYKMSRFFRDVDLWSFYENKLELKGIKVISVTEQLSDNPSMAKFQKTLIRGFDQYTSDTIGTLSRDGTKQVVRNGYWSGGPAPFGYSNEKIPNREGHTNKDGIVFRGTLVRNEQEARIVVRAYEIAAETGKGSSLVYKQLVAETNGHILGRNGQPLGAKGIIAILSNPIYKGEFAYNKNGYKKRLDDAAGVGKIAKKVRYSKPREQWTVVQNESWRLVSDEIWDAVQNARKENRSLHPNFGRQTRASYPLSGLVVCAVCNNNFGGKTQKSRNESFSSDSVYHYYRCRGSMNGSTACSNKTKIRGEEIEELVVNLVLEQVLSEKFILDIAEEIIALHRGATANKIDRPTLQERLNAIAVEQGNLVDLASRSSATIDVLAKRLDRLEKERCQIAKQLSAADPASSPLSITDLKPKIAARLNNARSMFKDNLAVDDLRAILKKWIQAIRVDGDGQVWIKWREKAVLELIGPAAVEVEAGEGSRSSLNFHSLSSLASWHCIPTHSEFSPSKTKSATCLVGFYGFASSSVATQNPAVASSSSGFSGFSGAAA